MITMSNIQVINATKARNDFFNLLEKSFLKKRSFLIKKSNIPMAYIVPINVVEDQKESQLALLERVRKLRESMTPTTNSTSLLRKMRRYE